MNRRSIKFKLLSITILLILCSVLLVSILSYFKYIKDFQEQSTKNTLQIAEQVSYNMATYLNEILRLAKAPYYNEELMRTLAQPLPETELGRLEKRRRVEAFLNTMMITPRQDIVSAYIISDEIYHGGRYYVSIDDSADLSALPWYNEAIETDKAVFVPTHDEQLILSPKLKVFSVVKRINKISDPSVCTGVIKVDANYSEIESIFKKVDFGADGGIFIVDKSQTVVYSSRSDVDALMLFSKFQGEKNNAITTTLAKEPYLLTQTDVPPANWTIITMNSLKELNYKAAQTRNSTVIMAALCALSAIIILLIFTNSFLNPLTEIIALMKEAKKGNLGVKFPDRRQDEIGELGSTFNAMLARINHMVSEVYEARALQSEAQMNALNSQIRPHFIFNTLNMISLQVQCEKYDTAVQNIEQLSELLRGVTHLDREITLEKELNLLRAYLSIQASRYQQRLSFDFDITPSLSEYVIPALTFQPIVENAVIHGCEQKSGETHIQISAEITEDFLIFTVADNADGIEEKALAELTERLNDAAFSFAEGGIGLVNVNKRIKIKFGAQYGITISSRRGEGTVVRAFLPKP